MQKHWDVMRSQSSVVVVGPEWKRHQFTEKYLSVDEEQLSWALVSREADGRKHVYWKPAYANERAIEECMRQLASRPDIVLSSAVTAANWRSFLTHSDNVLAKKAPDKYREAIGQQADACQKVFLRPISVICGGAGTGKTKVIDAIVKAIHSFLAQLKWLNDNWTFKRSGGKREEDVQTLIIDEASM